MSAGARNTPTHERGSEKKDERRSEKKVYLHLMLIAIKDSLSKDFSRPHEEILALSKGF